jgi:hypothetical protein
MPYAGSDDSRGPQERYMTSEATARTVEDDEQADTKLKRKITGPLLFLFILGDVLGAGIYADSVKL